MEAVETSSSWAMSLTAMEPLLPSNPRIRPSRSSRDRRRGFTVSLMTIGYLLQLYQWHQGLHPLWIQYAGTRDLGVGGGRRSCQPKGVWQRFSDLQTGQQA